jgi:aspartate kinase
LNNLLIMKFGGTSMGSAARIRVAAGLTAAQQRLRPTAIVVSAMSKVTDLLLDTLRHAENNDIEAIALNLATLRARHHDTAREPLDPAALPAALAEIDSILGEFERIAKGMQLLGDLPPRSVDEAIAVGERLSAILHRRLSQRPGRPGRRCDSARVVITDAVDGNATPLLDLTLALKPAEHLAPAAFVAYGAGTTGFNGATADGKPTTLGRGGGDFSASIFAYADAAELRNLDRRRRHHVGRSPPGAGMRRRSTK